MAEHHEMAYRAATLGLKRLGIPDYPHAEWICSCGHWRFRARPIPERETGNNLTEARHSHAVHVELSTARRVVITE